MPVAHVAKGQDELCSRHKRLWANGVFWWVTLLGTVLMPMNYDRVSTAANLAGRLGQFAFLVLVALIAWQLSRKSSLIVALAVLAAVAANWVERWEAIYGAG
jgi:hypothetical protein